MILQADTALVFAAGFSVDGDGAAKCYHPTDDSLALDKLSSAGHPGDWYGVVTTTGDKYGTPIVQVDGDPAPGFCVSQTALFDPTKNARDPRRYVDAASVPYISLPKAAFKLGVRLGDLAWVVYTVGDSSWECGAIVAEEGPDVGEGSIALADAITIPSSPKNGGVDSGVRYVVFRASAAPIRWPRNVDAFVREAEQRYADWGGDARLDQLLPIAA